MIPTLGCLIINYYFLHPIEFAFFYLIPFIVLLDLGTALWLIYWFYEQKPKIPNKRALRVLSGAVIFSLLAMACSSLGYLIMYAGNKAVSAEVGFGFVVAAMFFFLPLTVLFIIYFRMEKTVSKSPGDLEEEKA